MKSIKHLFYLVAEAAVWLIAIWGSYAAIASILLDWQTTERTYFDIFNEAVAIFPLTLLYIGSISSSIVLLLFLLIALSIISVTIYSARKNHLLKPHSFSSLKILFIILIVFTCLDFARLGYAWSNQSFTASQNSLKVIEFDDTRYIYVKQTDNTYDILVSDLNNKSMTALASYKRGNIGVPIYVSPDGKYFLTVSSADIFTTEHLQIRNIDGTIVKEMLWTGGTFLNTYNQPDFNNLSALWSPDGSILIIKGKEYDGEKVTFGTVTLFNASDFSEQIIPDFGAEIMDTGSNESGTFLLYNDPKHIRDYYSINISIARSGLIIGEPRKLSIGQCFSANKDLTVIGDNLYCLTSKLLYNNLKSKRNPDFPNDDRLLIHQKLSQNTPTDFSVVSPIIANSDYLVVTSDNKYLISYLGTASHDGTVPSENNVIYPTIVYETETGKQYEITDKNSPLYAAKPVQHRFLKFTGKI